MSPRKVSVVIEWDNAALTDDARPAAMLRRLGDELRASRDALAAPTELILAHDAAGYGHPRREPVDELLGPDAGFELEILAVPDGGYYALKNAGAMLAEGEVILFLDSDVVPEPRWLRALLAPFERPEVQVVGGNTYIEPTSLWSKAFALGWFFPLRSQDDAVVMDGAFYANSVAFRRETARGFPFPELSGAARASGVALSDRLKQDGIKIRTANGARVAHPAPNGLRHGVLRALAHGRDSQLLRQSSGDRSPLRPDSARKVARLVRRVFAERRRVGLSAAAAPLAAALVLGYYGLAAVGAVLTRIAPAAMRRLPL